MADTKKKDFTIRQEQAHTLTWWRTRKDQIDMDPPYQRRGRLWSPTDKAYLIDSILNGYDVPKLYVADFTWGDSALNQQHLPYAIIDGKQRFEAIFDFFSGEIVLNDDFVYLDKPELQLGGLGYQDLKKQHPDVAEIFEEYNLLVMGAFARTDEPINQLFVRLNRSKSLTGAEIRNAMSGPAPHVIRQISKHEFFKVNVRFSTQRAQDQNAAAKILLFEYDGELRETKKNNLDLFVRIAAKAKEKLELSARKTVDVLADMCEIVLPHDRLLGSAGIFPVYYWFVRNRSEKEHPSVRQFLVQFEKARKRNRNMADSGTNTAGIDKAMIQYDDYNRSTNDQKSHEGRFRILTQRFRQWRSKSGAS
jgi:hypothetical protein